MGVYIYEAHFECHVTLMLGKSPIKWRQRPDMTFAVDWDVKHQLKHSKLCVFLRRSWVFSSPLIAASVKPCIEIVLDILFKHAP